MKTLFSCPDCTYIVEVFDITESFSIRCQRCDQPLTLIGDVSQLQLDKYDEGLTHWISFGCPDCYCEEVYIDCSSEDQVCCECLRPECANYDVYIHEDAS